MVGAQVGPPGGSSSHRPGLTSRGGLVVLPRQWSVLKEGVQGVAVPDSPGSPASGDGESSQGGGRCLGRACGGEQFSTAQAHQPGRRGSPVQAAVGAHEGPVGDGSSQRPGPNSWVARGSCLGGGRLLEGAAGGR